MKTKKIILLLACILMGNIALMAQNSMSFGIRAGVNFQNINGKDAQGDQLDNTIIPGFNAGVNIEIPVGTDIYFQPGLLFSTKGAKSTETILLQEVTSKLSISYIELPLNIVFKPLLGTGHMLLGFGPYVGYGITGKYKIEGGNLSYDQDVKFKNEVSNAEALDTDIFYMKALDAGANFIIGYEMASMLSFQLNAQLGLINIYPKYTGIEDTPSWKNTGFGLSLGYRF